jgi:hypothetical protein
MSRRQRIIRCVYCGAKAGATRDHVPARQFFPSPVPPNLITVPSCEKCNKGWSMDEDYFRVLLVSCANTKGNAARDKLFPIVKASLARKQARGLASSFFNGIENVERVTPGGIYLGPAPFFTGDGRRLDRVAEKIIRGLFYHETKRRLPPDYRVATVHQSRVRFASPQTRTTMMEFVSATLETRPRCFGSSFAYWFLQSPNGWARSHWVLEFYGSREFYCFTAPIIGVQRKLVPLPA